MSEKCPFCDEPEIRRSLGEYMFRCGTVGPDSEGGYTTGRTCDIVSYNRLLAEKDAKINSLERLVESLEEVD